MKDKAWDTTFGSVVDSLLSGLGQALTMALVWWTKIPNAKLLDEQDLWQRISGYTNDIQVYLLAASVMVGAVRIAIARHHAHAEEAGEMVRVLARSVFAVWTAGAIVFAAARAGDMFSAWVIDDATHGDAKGTAEFLVQTSAYTAFSPGLVLILACVGILGALAMAVMAILRQAMLVVAMSLLPLAAAGSGLGSGKQAHERLWSWVAAFLLWKPVAALVYLVAFSTIDTDRGMDASAPVDADAAQRRLVGLVLLCCAVFVLPALMRLVSPIVAAAGSGGSGAAAAGAVLAAGAAVASGGKTLIARGAAARAGTVTAAGGSTTGHVTTRPASNSSPRGVMPRPTSVNGGSSSGPAATTAGAAPSSTRPSSRGSTTRPTPAAPHSGPGPTKPAAAGPNPSPRRPGGDIPI
ncbi:MULTISPECIES: hypothetical protein [unclassified Nocardia]|uniref:hypothetical protein n=1 Tax=unclassified Nocardia TaxID=2637762 RepID=UPI001CE43B8C|nr:MULTISPECIES: hypothetical protein [unclassified Nocardia]